MPNDERNDLLELKAFLDRAIPIIEQQLIDYPIDGLKADYVFLVNKAITYRETLKQINQQLKADEHE